MNLVPVRRRRPTALIGAACLALAVTSPAPAAAQEATPWDVVEIAGQSIASGTEPRVAVRGKGDSVAVWRGTVDGAVQVQVADVPEKRGAKGVRATPIAGSAAAGEPSVACDDGKSCVVAFAADSQLTFATSKGAGKWTRAAEALGSTTDARPALAIDDRGDATIAWVDGSGRVQVADVTAKGQVSSVTTVGGPATGTATLSVSDGRQAVTWWHGGQGFAAFSASGAWSAPVALGIAKDVPAVVSLNDGTHTVAWIAAEAVLAQDFGSNGQLRGTQQLVDPAREFWELNPETCPVPPPTDPGFRCVQGSRSGLRLETTAQGKVAAVVQTDGFSVWSQFLERAPGSADWTPFVVDGGGKRTATYSPVFVALPSGAYAVAWSWVSFVNDAESRISATLKTADGLWVPGRYESAEKVAAVGARTLDLASNDRGQLAITWFGWTADGGSTVSVARRAAP